MTKESLIRIISTYQLLRKLTSHVCSPVGVWYTVLISDNDGSAAIIRRGVAGGCSFAPSFHSRHRDEFFEPFCAISARKHALLVTSRPRRQSRSRSRRLQLSESEIYCFCCFDSRGYHSPLLRYPRVPVLDVNSEYHFMIISNFPMIVISIC